MIEFKQVLCPIDFSETSTKALVYASAIAAWYDGQLQLLHVSDALTEAPATPAASVGASGAMFDANAREQVLAEMRLHGELAVESRTWCEIEEAVALDAHRAYREILRRAATTNADLIVMGAQGSGSVELTMYGSITHHVIRAATCPVLTVRA